MNGEMCEARQGEVFSYRIRVLVSMLQGVSTREAMSRAVETWKEETMVIVKHIKILPPGLENFEGLPQSWDVGCTKSVYEDSEDPRRCPIVTCICFSIIQANEVVEVVCG